VVNPSALKPTRFRVARPTDQLDAIRKFYVDGIGLKVIGEFENHDGYDGLILGAAEPGYEIEFTTHSNGSPCPAPTLDNLLVFYLSTATDFADATARMNRLSHSPVESENPYWDRCGLTYQDPDGWRVTLVDCTKLQPPA
jgi:catechol 2,3-dioxygenase-like lactoylglutathione lyase family enzyme